MTFAASDGVRLAGRVYGGGRTWVVLSHMGRGGDSQQDWVPAAAEIAAAGYTVLTYNRRGVCPGAAAECSAGEDNPDDRARAWLDVVGAYRYARAQGANDVVLGGASIGAMETLHAVLVGAVQPRAVVWVAGILDGSGYRFNSAGMKSLRVPILYLSATRDSYGGAAAARQLYGWTTAAPRVLNLVDSGVHGTDLLYSVAGPDSVIKPMLAFITTHAPANAATSTPTDKPTCSPRTARCGTSPTARTS